MYAAVIIWLPWPWTKYAIIYGDNANSIEENIEDKEKENIDDIVGDTVSESDEIEPISSVSYSSRRTTDADAIGDICSELVTNRAYNVWLPFFVFK